jgi:hypothetical protein
VTGVVVKNEQVDLSFSFALLGPLTDPLSVDVLIYRSSSDTPALSPIDLYRHALTLCTKSIAFSILPQGMAQQSGQSPKPR